MNTLIKSAALAMLLGSSITVTAQSDNKKDKASDESKDIVIRKKGGSKEKMTIVIDGDNVTINGKPVDDYKGDGVEVMRDGDFDMEWDGDFDLAMPPGMPHGGMQMFGDDFLREVHSNRAFLGVMTEKADGGAKITDVTEKSAAEKAGLKKGDIITKINDDKIEDADDLYKAVGAYKPGEKVKVTYKRDGKENTATAELGENKQMRVFSFNNGDAKGLTAPMPPGDMQKFKYFNHFWGDHLRLGIQVQDTEDGNGVTVLEAEDDEPAAKAGIKEDDIITQVNGKAIKSVEDLTDIIKDAKSGDTLALTIKRNGSTQTINVKFPKDLKTTDL